MNEKTGNRQRRYIRITDQSLWEIIDEIMTLPQYQNSFNKVINDALFYGLESLRQSLFGEARIEEIPGQPQAPQSAEDEFYFKVVALLKEIVVNMTMNKSMLCSLFNASVLAYNHKAIDGNKFQKGAYRDTPDYLVEYEIQALKDTQK